MTQQADSLHAGAHAPEPEQQPQESGAAAATGHAPAARPVHPWQVLSKLPPNATPAQQDSAIQAVFRPNNVHLSDRPDTLGLPGYEKGRGVNDMLLPENYREFYHADDSLLRTDVGGDRYGVAGDPMPYTISGDNVITSLLLACFILALVSYASSRDFILRQAKNFFLLPRGGTTTEVTETTSELRFQFMLAFSTCLLASIISFFYTQERVADTFVFSSPYLLIWIFFGCYLAYFLLKALVYALVNAVFFDRKQGRQWQKSLLFLISMEGVALFPVVLLQAYFGMTMQHALIYTLVVVAMVKILAFYKAYAIFFHQKGAFLQIILYFCALEIVPLFALWGILVTIVDILKINF